MRSRALWIVALFLLTQTGFASDLKSVAKQAVSSNADDAKSAIEALRDAGPEGLSAILDANKELIAQHKKARDPELLCNPEWKRIASAIDAVATQHDAWASGLYWYTNLDDAKRAAREQHKPILSLRLLGQLDEEYSCANSRFFRTALYANKDISSYLAQNFILHWQSERPVPKITIDFGDGRKIERTITGNSIHYILSPDGGVIDALPGLYAPKRFLAQLSRAQQMSDTYCAASDPTVKGRMLIVYHQRGAADLELEYQRDLKAINATRTITISSLNNNGAAPSAKKAAPIAVSKSGVEVPVLNQTMPGDVVAAEDAIWKKIAALHQEDAKLDPSSVALVASKQDPAAAMRRTMSKAVVENPLLKIVSNFERSIAEDTVRNEYLLHRQIHQWLAQKPVVDLNTFNERVYAELFLTPSSDPWLGLAPANTYTALPSEGLVVSQK